MRAVGPHDLTIKAVLREPGVADALLRERLPRSTARRIVGPAVAMPETFVDESLRASVADLLLRVPVRGGTERYVYCLVEHKRRSDRGLMVQLLRYLAAIYSRLAKVHRAQLPPVIPLIIYNGDRPWKGPSRFGELLAASRAERELTVDFGTVLVDVGAEPEEALSRHPLLGAGLVGLRVANVASAVQRRLMEQALGAFSSDPSTQRLLLQYFAKVAEPTALASVIQKRTQGNDMQTFAEFHEAKGLRKGRRQGRQRGRQEGRVEALRDALAVVLKSRFARLTPTVEGQLAAGSSDQLERWLHRAVTARSLKAIFSES